MNANVWGGDKPLLSFCGSHFYSTELNIYQYFLRAHPTTFGFLWVSADRSANLLPFLHGFLDTVCLEFQVCSSASFSSKSKWKMGYLLLFSEVDKCSSTLVLIQQVSNEVAAGIQVVSLKRNYSSIPLMNWPLELPQVVAVCVHLF